MNQRLWLRILLALLVVAVAVLELTAMPSVRRGFGVFVWSLFGLGLGTIVVIVATAVVQRGYAV